MPRCLAGDERETGAEGGAFRVGLRGLEQGERVGLPWVPAHWWLRLRDGPGQAGRWAGLPGYPLPDPCSIPGGHTQGVPQG